jgi:hypothetical protein
MLVYFHKGFLMEGTNCKKVKKHFWSKPDFVQQKIYCTTGISGICDESELDAEVERLTQEQLSTDGWGYRFDCWHRVVPYTESLEIAKLNKWEADFPIPANELVVKTLDNWTVEHAAKELNGKQFAQYCRDYGIVIKDVQTYDL